MSTSALPSYTLATAGPLTTRFTPPSSCLSTTTQYKGQFFIGSAGALGLDPNCYPHPQSTAAASTMGSRKMLEARDGVTTIQIFSPGICPSGWTYAESYVSTPTVAQQLRPPHFSVPTGTESAYTYFCCPPNFNLQVLSVGASPTIGVNYPLCTYTADYLEYWRFTSGLGWPTADIGNSLPMSTIDYDDDSSDCSKVTVTASGLAVAWKANDIVEPYISANVAVPFWPPRYPTPTPICGGSHTAKTAAGIGAAVAVLLIWSCLCWGACVRARRKRNLAANRVGNVISTQGSRTAQATVSGWDPRPESAAEDYYPLTSVQQAHVHETGSELHRERGESSTGASVAAGELGEPVPKYGQTEQPEGSRPPPYDEVVRMDEENLDERGPGISSIRGRWVE